MRFFQYLKLPAVYEQVSRHRDTRHMAVAEDSRRTLKTNGSSSSRTVSASSSKYASYGNPPRSRQYFNTSVFRSCSALRARILRRKFACWSWSLVVASSMARTSWLAIALNESSKGAMSEYSILITRGSCSEKEVPQVLVPVTKSFLFMKHSTANAKGSSHSRDDTDSDSHGTSSSSS